MVEIFLVVGDKFFDTGSIPVRGRYVPVAQLVEHLTFNRVVGGSSPSRRTIKEGNMKQRSLFSKPKSSPPKSTQRTKETNSGIRKRVEANHRFTQPMLEKMKLTNPEDIKVYELIQRRRLQILVWSRMYYKLDTSVVSDSKFDKVGHELVKLQHDYPEISKMVAYAEEFADWDASSGFNLPLQDPWVCQKTEQLLKWRG